MKIGIRKTLLLVSALILAGSVQAQTEAPAPYQEGLHYFLVADAPATTTGPLELVEAFSYLCTHCNTFEPYITAFSFQILSIMAACASSPIPIMVAVTYPRAYISQDARPKTIGILLKLT